MFADHVKRPRVTILLFAEGILFGDAFSKEEEVSKGVPDEKLLVTPQLGLQGG